MSLQRLPLFFILVAFLHFCRSTQGRVLYQPQLERLQAPEQSWRGSDLSEIPPLVPPPPPECARLWDQSRGVIHFNLNQEVGPLDGWNFIPMEADVRANCTLVIMDVLQKVVIITKTSDSTVFLPPGQCPIRYAACESCLEKVPQSLEDADFGQNSTEIEAEESICAILYEARHCSTTLGWAFEVQEDEKEHGLSFELRRRVSSMVVRDGCALEIYDEDGFEGNAAIVTGTIHELEEKWDNQIVSFKCTCNGEIILPTPETEIPFPETTTEFAKKLSSTTTNSPTPLTSSTTEESPIIVPEPEPTTSTFRPPTSSTDDGFTVY